MFSFVFLSLHYIQHQCTHYYYTMKKSIIINYIHSATLHTTSMYTLLLHNEEIHNHTSTIYTLHPLHAVAREHYLIFHTHNGKN